MQEYFTWRLEVHVVIISLLAEIRRFSSHIPWGQMLVNGEENVRTGKTSIRKYF
jgi:hypothetical protein